jgi:hypothetical protein
MEVLWITKKELVEEEMKRMIEEDGRTCPKFELRTAASKRILSNMTESELRKLEKAKENISKRGYSEEHKRM